VGEGVFVAVRLLVYLIVAVGSLFSERYREARVELESELFYD
jgi:hypothetical protein